MELITVVIPVYNTEKYIEKCVKSFINQTYTNLELILVDDGSTDKSPFICDHLTKVDSRIKVIHKANGGLSDARNTGLERANGSLITFFDSDDFVEPQYIEYLCQLKNKYDTQVSTCAYKLINEKEQILTTIGKEKECAISKVEVYRRMLLDDGITVSACFKLYDIKLFQNVRFPVGKICEDNGTTYKIIENAKGKIAYGNIAYGYYLIRRGSIMRSSFNIKKLDMIEMTEQMCTYLLAKYPELYTLIKRRRIYSRFNVLCQISDYEKAKEHADILIDYILKETRFIICSRDVPLRDKLACLILLVNKKLFFFIWRTYKTIKYKQV